MSKPIVPKPATYLYSAGSAVSSAASSAITSVKSMSGNLPQVFTGLAILTMVILSILSFVILVPMNSIPAMTGISIIISVSYMISFLLWILITYFISDADRSLYLISAVFLIAVPATISATAMNVVTIQNTTNLMNLGKT